MHYLESTARLPEGFNSVVAFPLARSRSQISRTVSFEKSASTAPAFVPVTICGETELADHANVAVLGISLRRTMVLTGVQGAEKYTINVQGERRMQTSGNKWEASRGAVN